MSGDEREAQTARSASSHYKRALFSHVILQGTLPTACFINAILAHLTVRTGLNSGNYCYRFVNSLLGLLY